MDETIGTTAKLRICPKRIWPNTALVYRLA